MFHSLWVLVVYAAGIVTPAILRAVGVDLYAMTKKRLTKPKKLQILLGKTRPRLDCMGWTRLTPNNPKLIIPINYHNPGSSTMTIESQILNIVDIHDELKGRIGGIVQPTKQRITLESNQTDGSEFMVSFANDNFNTSSITETTQDFYKTLDMLQQPFKIRVVVNYFYEGKSCRIDEIIEYPLKYELAKYWLDFLDSDGYTGEEISAKNDLITKLRLIVKT